MPRNFYIESKCACGVKMIGRKSKCYECEERDAYLRKINCKRKAKSFDEFVSLGDAAARVLAKIGKP